MTSSEDCAFYPQLVVAECRTDKDIQLASRLTTGCDKKFPTLILRLKRIGLFLESYDSEIFPQKPPIFFLNRHSLWKFLQRYSANFETLITMHLADANLPEGALNRSCMVFRNKKVSYAISDYRQFTQAHWEFISSELYSTITGNIQNSGYFLKIDTSAKREFIWPDREDYQYYYGKDSFEQNFSAPISVAMDLHPGCNKRCDKCQYHSPRSPFAHFIRRDQVMSPELAFRLIDEMSMWNPKPSLCPTFSGEPLLYPHLKEVLLYAKSKGVLISITTNGMALDKEMSRMLLEIGIHRISISIDAATQETYEALQSPGNLQVVKNNIETFLAMRGIWPFPFIGVHFVMDEKNQDEFASFLKYWSPKLNFVSRAIKQDPFSASQAVMPPWLPLGKRQTCWCPWTTMYVRWDGSISFCGFDFHGQPNMNANKQSLKEIWNSPQFWEWRNAQLSVDRKILYCNACPDWSAQRSVVIENGGFQIIRTPISEEYTRSNRVIRMIKSILNG